MSTSKKFWVSLGIAAGFVACVMFALAVRDYRECDYEIEWSVVRETFYVWDCRARQVVSRHATEERANEAIRGYRANPSRRIKAAP